MKGFLVLVLIVLSIFSCSKYEEGPGFSLRSKKSRLVGEWKLISINNEVEIVEESGKFIKYSYNCGQEYTVYETIVTKTDVVWEIEDDYDMKEKYFGVVQKFKYGQSYIFPDCIPVYSITDSTDLVDVNEWSFSSGKKELQIKKGEVVTEYEIIRLSNSDLKISNDLGDVYVFEKI